MNEKIKEDNDSISADKIIKASFLYDEMKGLIYKKAQLLDKMQIGAIWEIIDETKASYVSEKMSINQLNVQISGVKKALYDKWMAMGPFSEISKKVEDLRLISKSGRLNTNHWPFGFSINSETKSLMNQVAKIVDRQIEAGILFHQMHKQKDSLEEKQRVESRKNIL